MDRQANGWTDRHIDGDKITRRASMERRKDGWKDRLLGLDGALRRNRQREGHAVHAGSPAGRRGG